MGGNAREKAQRGAEMILKKSQVDASQLELYGEQDECFMRLAARAQDKKTAKREPPGLTTFGARARMPFCAPPARMSASRTGRWATPKLATSTSAQAAS